MTLSAESKALVTRQFPRSTDPRPQVRKILGLKADAKVDPTVVIVDAVGLNSIRDVCASGTSEWRKNVDKAIADAVTAKDTASEQILRNYVSQLQGLASDYSTSGWNEFIALLVSLRTLA